jgi:hypothetical protein
MTLLHRIKKSKYQLLYTVLPAVIIVGAIKIAAHFLHWEIIPTSISTFFPSILTGIIFILGFLLAGVVTDYKESEKLPNEIAVSLYSIWQEAEYLRIVSDSQASVSLMKNIKNFIPILKYDFFVLQNDKILTILDNISSDIIKIGQEEAPPPYIARMKNETINLKKYINRIAVIKNTDFIPSVFTTIQVIAVIFLLVFCLLHVEPWWGGLIVVSIFTIVIFSILNLIKDMDDPFEYDETGEIKSDEVSLEVLDNLQAEFDKKEF